MRIRKYVVTAVIDGEEVNETYVQLDRAQKAVQAVLTISGTVEVEVRMKRIWEEG